MNKQQYATYQGSVEHNLKHLSFVSTGACPGCKECGLPEVCCDREQEAAEQPYFSWHPCEACGSDLGGNRHPAHGRGANNAIEHFSVCEYCLYYLNYGRLDDTTMEEIRIS